MKIRDAIRIIERDGWVQVRQKGSHQQYRHAKKPGIVTIAGHPSEDVPTGTIKNIMKQADIDR